MQLQSEAVVARVDRKPSHGPPSNLLPFQQRPLIAVLLKPIFSALLKALSDTEREEMKTKIEKTTTQLCSVPKCWQSYPREKKERRQEELPSLFFPCFFFLTISFLPQETTEGVATPVLVKGKHSARKP